MITDNLYIIKNKEQTTLLLKKNNKQYILNPDTLQWRKTKKPEGTITPIKNKNDNLHEKIQEEKNNASHAIDYHRQVISINENNQSKKALVHAQYDKIMVQKGILSVLNRLLK